MTTEITEQPKDLGPVDDAEFAQILEEHIRAGIQCASIETAEETRVETEITKIAQGLKMGVITWDCYEGFSYKPLANQDKLKDPQQALAKLADESAFSGNMIFIFRDVDDYFSHPGVRRRLRTLCESNKLVNKRFKRPLIIISPSIDIHKKLKSCVYPIDFSLPSEEKLYRTFDFVRSSIEAKNPEQAQCGDELRETIVQNLMGLTSTEAENALAVCLVRHGGYCEDMLKTIKGEKASIIKKSEVLTYISEEEQPKSSEIGGWENLLRDLDECKLVYSRRATELRYDMPKGLGLIGVPGTAKSIGAYMIARRLGLNCLQMNMGALFGSYVGESEARVRDALRTIKAQQGCVVVMDEFDKAFGNVTSNKGDSGTALRVFGEILSWMAKNNDRTFPVVTMNRVQGIPPEFFRDGRLDGWYYTDLPDDSTRRKIFDIHFGKRGITSEMLGFDEGDWGSLVQKTHEYVGSEIEGIVKRARRKALTRVGKTPKPEDGIPTFDEMMEAVAGVIPMSVRDNSGISEIRSFCKDFATPVGFPEGTDNTRQRAVDVSNN